MEVHDPYLIKFEQEGSEELPQANEQGYITNQGARIWYSTFGNRKGKPVVLLHGGLGHSGNWGYQVKELIEKDYKVVLIDSRGHGHSSRDEQPFTYQLMAYDLAAVLDFLDIKKVGLVGWSDGAVTSLIFADLFPERVFGVFYFACNMDNSGTIENIEYGPTLTACFHRHTLDYAKLSATPNQFDSFIEAVGVMQRTQPNYSISDLERIKVPVLIVQSEHDEFIKLEHAKYLAETIPNAKFHLLMGVSHFAPLQRPDQFNKVIIDFLREIFA